MKSRPWMVFISLLVFCISCDPSTDPAAQPTVRFSPEEYARGNFYAIPWPSALRLKNGTLDLQNLPARETNFILSAYLPAVEERLGGFSPNGAILFFLDTTLDTASLPLTEATLESDSPVQLVNIEPASKRYGERIPLEARFSSFGGTFQPENTLTLLPLAGFPMAPGERYAAILLRGVRTPQGALATAPWVRRLLNQPAKLPEAGFDALVASLAYLHLEASDIVAATVFRTSDPGHNVRHARHVMLRDIPAPLPSEIEKDLTYAECPTYVTATTYHLIQGKFSIPGFLKGPAPYVKFGTGMFVRDAKTGEPIVQEMETVFFTLSVPDATAPTGGFPVAIYQHGAGGDRHSFVRDFTACSLAERGIAGLAIDFPIHGDRNPPPKHDITFLLVNPENIPAVIDIENQAAIDLFSLTRLLPNLVVPAGTLGAGMPEIRLRASQVGYIGHSQGSFVGVPFLAYESAITAAVLSGSGAHGITFITDRIAGQSIDIQLILGIQDAGAIQEGIAVLLGIPGEKADRFHFLFTLIQTIMDPLDPINYAPYVIRETEHPKHIYQSAGFLDSYDPPRVNEALAAALGLDIIEPLELEFPKLRLRGGKVLPAPVAGNKSIDGKKITAVNSQFPGGDHWVYLKNGIARTQGTDFLASALKGGPVTVPARCIWVDGKVDCN